MILMRMGMRVLIRGVCLRNFFRSAVVSLLVCPSGVVMLRLRKGVGGDLDHDHGAACFLRHGYREICICLTRSEITEIYSYCLLLTRNLHFIQKLSSSALIHCHSL